MKKCMYLAASLILVAAFVFGGRATVVQAATANFSASISTTEFTYTGSEKRPKVTVKNSSGTVISSSNYTVEYVDNKNAGTAKVIVTGVGSYTGTVEKTFTIKPADLTNCTADLAYTTVAYTGGSKTPSVTVKTAKGTVLKKGTHYTVAYENNKIVGTASVTISGMGNYEGTIQKTFEITPADISVCTITIASELHYADGKAYCPKVTVTTARGTVLKKDASYSVTYKDNVEAGTASAVITGMGNYTGTVTKTYKITARKPLSDCTITLSYTTATWSGTAKTPAVTVKTATGTTLKKGTNYTVTYTNNVEVGKATVTITGIDKYSGTVTKTFTIRPDRPTSLSKHYASTYEARIQWKASKQATKYYVYKNGKYYTSVKSTACRITGLSRGTTYTFTVKAVKTVDGKDYVSSGSSIRVTTKSYVEYN